MLKGLLGSEDAERVLLYLLAREQGYGREIAAHWQTTQTGVKRQLARLDAAGVLMGHAVGRTRVYTWNPRYPFATELKALLTKTLSYLPDAERERLTMHRRRPRRAGKP